jgi:hypothetical protein
VYRCLIGVVIGLAAASLAAGCGGGGGGDPSATEWADDVCSAISSWSESITSTADSLRGGNLSEDSVNGAVDDLESATNDFVDDLRGLGTPDTASGVEARQSLDKLADEADESLTTVQSAIDDAEGLSGLVGAVTAIGTALSTMGDKLSSTMTQLEQLDAGGELETAFKEADSCNDLQSG